MFETVTVVLKKFYLFFASVVKNLDVNLMKSIFGYTVQRFPCLTMIAIMLLDQCRWNIQYHLEVLFIN